MTADLKPCPFCGMAPSRSYGGRSGNRIWCANERCQERPLIAAETWSGAASIWNPIAPTVSDTGPGTSGLRTPQPGEAPRSDAPAPTMADLINNLMHIEMLTATGDGLDPATTIDVHLLAAIGRAVDDDAAWHFRAPAPAIPDMTDPVAVHLNMLRGTIAKPTPAQIKHLYPDLFSAPAPTWLPIETAPRDGTPVLTYSADAAADLRQGSVGNPGTPILVMAYIVGEWELVDEIGDWHIPQYDPTHWMPLPAPPVDSSAAPSTPRRDNRRKADIIAAAEQEEQEK